MYCIINATKIEYEDLADYARSIYKGRFESLQLVCVNKDNLQTYTCILNDKQDSLKIITKQKIEIEIITNTLGRKKSVKTFSLSSYISWVRQNRLKKILTHKI